MDAVPDEELTLSKPYSQARLARRADVAARRVRSLAAGAGVALAAYGLTWAGSPGPWLFLAALQGVVVAKLPRRPLWVVALATLLVFLGVLLPLRAMSLYAVGAPGFGSGGTLTVSLLALIAALVATPWVVTLLRDQEFREAFVSLE